MGGAYGGSIYNPYSAYGGSIYNPEYMLEDVCAAAREPPLLPDEVRSLLKLEKKFTSRADVQVVAGLYERFFDGASRFAQRLDFNGLGWAAPEAEKLLRVVPHFVACSTLECVYPPAAPLAATLFS